MHPFLIYALAAGAEIAGCYIVWGWLRLGYGPLWLVPGVALLTIFAGLLSLIPELSAGRTFAAYGGVYIVASLAWMWAVESIRPDRFDLIGATVCLFGAAIILLAPRAG